jgi:hypothetical protein
MMPLKLVRASIVTCPLWPVLVAMGWLCGWGRAEEPASEHQTKAKETVTRQIDDRTKAVVAAAGVAGAHNPFLVFGLMRSGQEFSIWQGLPSFSDQEISAGAPPLLNLDAVQDGTPMQSGEEELAYGEALVKAFKTSQEAFQKSTTRGLLYANLFYEPKRYRGQVVHFEGRLKRLLRSDPPESTKLDGAQDQYEGWMFDVDNYGANPVCVVFTHLPPGLEPGDKLDVRVAFDGYFFKRYRYKDGEGKLRDAPLLIGHTVVLRDTSPPSSEAEGALSGLLMGSAWVLIIGTIIVGVALFWWYRRNDRDLQRRLAAVNPPNFDEPPASSESPAERKEEIREQPWFEN